MRFVRQYAVVVPAFAALFLVSASGASSGKQVPLCSAPFGDGSVDTRGVTMTVSWVPPRPRARRQVSWLFRVANSSPEPRQLKFPTSQVVDVELRQHGAIRYRWSHGRGFLFMVTGRELAAQSVWSCHVSDKLDVKPGRYTLLAWLNGSANKLIVRRQITIRS